MHLERANSSDHYHHMRDESTITTFDVEELLHTDVCAEARFCHNVIRKLQCDLVGDDGGLSMRDVGERSCVDEGGVPFQRLHKVGFDRVLHQHCDCASYTEVFCRDGFAAFVRGNDHSSESFAHVFEARCQCKDR